MSDQGTPNDGMHYFDYEDDSKYAALGIDPGNHEFLIKNVRYWEYDSYDFAATISANLNLCVPFLNVGIVNIYAIK